MAALAAEALCLTSLMGSFPADVLIPWVPPASPAFPSQALSLGGVEEVYPSLKNNVEGRAREERRRIDFSVAVCAPVGRRV